MLFKTYRHFHRLKSNWTMVLAVATEIYQKWERRKVWKRRETSHDLKHTTLSVKNGKGIERGCTTSKWNWASSVSWWCGCWYEVAGGILWLYCSFAVLPSLSLSSLCQNYKSCVNIQKDMDINEWRSMEVVMAAGLSVVSFKSYCHTTTYIMCVLEMHFESHGLVNYYASLQLLFQ